MDKSPQHNGPTPSSLERSAFRAFLTNKTRFALFLLGISSVAIWCFFVLQERAQAGTISSGWHLAGTLAIFAFVFVASQLGYRVYYASTARAREVATTRAFEVQSERGLKIRIAVVGFVMSVMALYSLYGTLNLSEAAISPVGQVAMFTLLALLLPLMVVTILPIIFNKAMLSDTHLELVSLLKGRRSIALSAIEDVVVKRSLEAKLSLDTKGDTLVIRWLSESGAVAEDSIRLHHYMKNRDLLFGLLKKRVEG